MQSGKMLVADHDGIYMIKLMGDVRLTLCHTFDDYFAKMFADKLFTAVTVDLSAASGIDSTSLGLLAKLAIETKKRFHKVPTIISPLPDITRLLQSMGFQKVFNITTKNVVSNTDLEELSTLEDDDECARCKIVEAHKVLMGMNEKNRTAFAELVTALESKQQSE